MAKTHIVILEDDYTLGNALKESFVRAGGDVTLCANTQDCLKAIEKTKPAMLFVDCLLPDGSGVDFVENLRRKYPANDLNITMMSGIFTDASVIKEINRSTKAVHFLKKPFEVQEALKLVKLENEMPAQQDLTPRKQLYLLFNKPRVTIRDKRKVIEALDEIHGFDLPFIYSLLVETSATGHLNIIVQKDQVLGISFSNGKIVSVDIVDVETQIGNLLIEGGFIKPDDLQEGLAQRSQKRIGERLITSNLLSPHAFNIAMANQMSIRLSRTIIEAPIKVNFVPAEIELSYPHIDSHELTKYLHDWVASKIDFEWLRAHYTQWGDYALGKSSSYDEKNPVLKSPLLVHLPGFVEYFTSGVALDQLMEKKKFAEEPSYKALHFLLTKGVLIFTEKVISNTSPAEHLKHLKKYAEQFVGKSPLETWETFVSITGGTESEPDLVKSEFLKMLGDAPADLNSEIGKIYTELLKMLEDSIRFASGDEKKKALDEAQKKGSESKQKAIVLFDEAKALLQKSQYTQATAAIARIKITDPTMTKVKTLSLWCKLGQIETMASKEQALNEVEMELMQIPPEEKFEGTYQFVLGLYHKARRDVELAKQYFEKAYHLDSSMLAARREIALLMQKPAPKPESKNDLGSFFKGFFKRS